MEACPGRASAPSRRNGGQHPAAFLSIAPEGVKSLGLMLRAAEHVVDLRTHESVAPKLNVHSGTEVDACLFPWAPDDYLLVGCLRDRVGDLVAHFKAAGTNAGPNRSDEGAPVESFSQPLQRRMHNPGYKPPPTRVDGRCIAARLVRDKHGHAIRDTHTHGDRAARGTCNDGVGLRVDVALESLKGVCPVHLFGPRDVAGIRKVQRGGESTVADPTFWESVTEPSPDEKRGLQEDHADR
jgi:hypothetical protein